MKNKIKIDGFEISENSRPYIIAEMSGNHNGNIDRALKLIELAKASGANAVKLQTYTSETMTIDHHSKDFKINGGLWNGYSLHELYKMAHTPWDWHERLFQKGKQIGITVFSTPFDNTAVDFLENLNTPAYKIASFENSDIPLIKKIASTGKPILMSTGMANLKEIEESVNTIKEAGCKELVLLHCVSGYPTSIKESNLKTIRDLKSKFNVIVGLSDHTPGNITSIAAISLGAKIIEKHFTLKRSDGGPDASFSLEKDELKSLVDDCNKVHLALGKINYEKTSSEEMSSVFRRSIYVVKDIDKGDVFNKNNIRIIRPGYGLEPKYFEKVIGKVSNRKLLRGTAFSLNFVQN